MKKTLLLLLISIFTAALLFGATALVSKGISQKVADCPSDTSDDYTIEEFIPPKKTCYSLSEINSYKLNPDGSGEYILTQEIDFDGTGMSMVVKNNTNGNIQEYTYNCDYFKLDDQLLKFEEYFWFDFSIEENANANGVLTPGKYSADVILVTDDGGYITTPFYFTVEASPEATTPTEPETQNNTEAEQGTEKPTQENALVMPKLSKRWHKVNDDGGHIEILQQNGNDLKLLVTNSYNGTHFVSTKVSITLKDVHMVDGVMKGTSAFNYTDSTDNKGVGVISVSENSIVLTMKQEYDKGAGWSVNNTTGKYIIEEK